MKNENKKQNSLSNISINSTLKNIEFQRKYILHIKKI